MMLRFQPITVDSLSEIQYYIQFQNYRTCDFTIGGMFMWADYFKYEYAVFKETLFIKGVSEINLTEIAFSIPIGKLDLTESVFILKEYCDKQNIKLVLSAVPENTMQQLVSLFSFTVCKLDNWADYVYDSQKIATFQGKLYNKKRNHVNNFKNACPDFVYKQIDKKNIHEAIAFFHLFDSYYQKDNSIFLNESRMTEYVLTHYEKFNFVGYLLIVQEKTIGFIIGEILLDTLYIHIAKADKSYSGVYEMLYMELVKNSMNLYPSIQYVNMEEDVGDAGLRKSKLSYHPAYILNKYNLIYHDQNSTDNL